MTNRQRSSLSFLAGGAVVAATALLQCKPAANSVVSEEVGGAIAVWRVSAMLTGGELRIDRNTGVGPGPGTLTSPSDGIMTSTSTDIVDGAGAGIGAGLTTAKITSAMLELAQAPSGATTDQNLRPARFMDLTAGAGEVRVNLLMATEDSGFCYVNGMPLFGTSQQVTCKDATTMRGTVETDTARRREALASACERLSQTRAQWDREGFLARSDRNQDFCVCLTGRERQVPYSDYQTRERDERLFEADCRAAPLSSQPVQPLPVGVATGTNTDLVPSP